MNIEISAKSKINVVEWGSRKRKIKSLIQNKKMLLESIHIFIQIEKLRDFLSLC